MSTTDEIGECDDTHVLFGDENLSGVVVLFVIFAILFSISYDIAIALPTAGRNYLIIPW